MMLLDHLLLQPWKAAGLSLSSTCTYCVSNLFFVPYQLPLEHQVSCFVRIFETSASAPIKWLGVQAYYAYGAGSPYVVVSTWYPHLISRKYLWILFSHIIIEIQSFGFYITFFSVTLCMYIILTSHLIFTGPHETIQWD